MSNPVKKLPLIVSCLGPHPDKGSEQGKAFSWTLALSKYYDVHVFCREDAADVCRTSKLCDEWKIYPVEMGPPKSGGLNFYVFYKKWCDLVIKNIRKRLPEIRPVGLHHPVLGSFRMLPRYDTLNLKYTLGPLGGGEFVPRPFLYSAMLPPKVLVEETLRPLINLACVKNPMVASVLKNASHILASTEQSADVIKSTKVQSVSCIFPDVFSGVVHYDAVIARRTIQVKTLSNDFVLLFSGRALWWKGGHLAIHILEVLKKRGVKVRLSMVTEGPARPAWEILARNLGVNDLIAWSDFVPRVKLLQLYSEAHAYVYPTMHDSSSSAIPEAYSTGLPSVTLGIGGAGTASTSETGFNEYRSTAPDWIHDAASAISQWVKHPEQWYAASTSALDRTTLFSLISIENAVKEHIVPAFR